MVKYFTPKEAAKKSGYSLATLKRYEMMGKLKPKRNPENNYRVYTAADIDRIKNIGKKMQRKRGQIG